MTPEEAFNQERYNEQRRQVPLRNRVSETVVVGLQIIRDGVPPQVWPDMHQEMIRRGTESYQNDPLFHAVAKMVTEEILQEFRIGGKE